MLFIEIKKKLDTVKKVFSYYSEDVDTYFQKIEWIKADLLDVPSLEKALIDVTHIYHCAAFISFDPKAYHTLRKVNIEGTANIVNLSISNAIKNFVM